MKKTIFIALAAIALLSGCSKIKHLADVNVDIPYTAQQSVPEVDGYPAGIPLPGSITLSFPSIAVATNSKEYLAQYGSAAHLVVSVYLKSLAIQMQSPPNRNFDFLDNIQVFLSAKTLPEKLVASQDNIPKGSSTLNLKTYGEVNLKDYFLQDTIYFRLNAQINATPPAGEEITISSVFHLLANPLN